MAVACTLLPLAVLKPVNRISHQIERCCMHSGFSAKILKHDDSNRLISNNINYLRTDYQDTSSSCFYVFIMTRNAIIPPFEKASSCKFENPGCTLLPLAVLKKTPSNLFMIRWRLFCLVFFGKTTKSKNERSYYKWKGIPRQVEEG